MYEKIQIQGQNHVLPISIEANVYPDRTVVIEHRTLKELVESYQLSYTLHADAIDLQNGQVVYNCTLKDPNHPGNRTISALGWTMSEEDRPAGTNPVQIAATRAFDAAVISLFGFQDVIPESGLAGRNEEPKMPPEGKKGMRPPMPEGLPDTILIGSLQGKSYQAYKDSDLMSQTIRFLASHPNLTFVNEAQEKQAAFFKSLGGESQ